MSDELKDILGNTSKDIDNQKLMDYLSRKLSSQENHELEKMMADDEFMNDALEGLEQVNDKKEIPVITEQLNRALQKQLAKKQFRKEKRRLKEQPWIYFAIITMLLLCVIAYVVIKKKMVKDEPAKNNSKTSLIYHINKTSRPL